MNGGNSGRLKLEEQLKVYTDDDSDPVPAELMQKYIAYARTYVNPTLSSAAKKVECLRHLVRQNFSMCLTLLFVSKEGTLHHSMYHISLWVGSKQMGSVPF